MLARASATSTQAKKHYALMGNYDCRGALIGVRSRKVSVLSCIRCHLWDEREGRLYLLLSEKRPLLPYRKSLTFHRRLLTSQDGDLYRQLGNSIGLHYHFHNKAN